MGIIIMLISMKNCLIRYYRNKISKTINNKVEVIVIMKIIWKVKWIILGMNRNKIKKILKLI
jgi:hypothetical protein